jgi:hypothetical protein
MDLAMEPTLWALLEPDGMKAVLRRWLVQNLRNGAWLDVRKTSGYDARQYDHMYGYAYNACNFLYAVDGYLRVSGDRAFLDEKLENGQTVFERMDALATDWQTLPRGPHGLVDFGGNECLLECDPSYAHCVASMNAQVVWMLRTMADWHDARGDAAQGNELRATAAAFLPKVKSLYKEGDGVWYDYHLDGRKVAVRHCMDYVFVGMALRNDLTAEQKQEMNAFVKRELFMRDWMRAMSLRDEAAGVTNRADHGPHGSYDAWIPLTVGAMWRLGDTRAAFDFYRRTAVVTREGPFTQAHEFYGPTWDAFAAPVRISEVRGNLREASGDGSFANVVLDSFFGFSPGISGGEILADPAVPRPFEGELRNVRFHGKEIGLHADRRGVSIVDSNTH